MFITYAAKMPAIARVFLVAAAKRMKKTAKREMDWKLLKNSFRARSGSLLLRMMRRKGANLQYKRRLQAQPRLPALIITALIKSQPKAPQALAAPIKART